jgi:hypothetical protein
MALEALDPPIPTRRNPTLAVLLFREFVSLLTSVCWGLTRFADLCRHGASKRGTARIAELHGIRTEEQTHPFRIILEASSSGLDRKTLSRWTRALRFMWSDRDNWKNMGQLFEREGGIAGCAAVFTRGKKGLEQRVAHMQRDSGIRVRAEKTLVGSRSLWKRGPETADVSGSLEKKLISMFNGIGSARRQTGSSIRAGGYGCPKGKVQWR